MSLTQVLLVKSLWPKQLTKCVRGAMARGRSRGEEVQVGSLDVCSGVEEVHAVSAVAVSGGACSLRLRQSAHAAVARQMDHTMNSNGAVLHLSPRRWMGQDKLFHGSKGQATLSMSHSSLRIQPMYSNVADVDVRVYRAPSACAGGAKAKRAIRIKLAAATARSSPRRSCGAVHAAAVLACSRAWASGAGG